MNRPTTLYGLFDADTRRWWHHAQLREQGNAAEARKLERASIREDVRTYRRALDAGGFWTVGRGGSTLYIDANSRVEGYGSPGDELGMIAECQHLRLPGIDSTTIPDSKVWTTVALPMPCTADRTPDAAPWGSLSTAPFPVVAALYQALGATLHDCPDDLPTVAEILPQLSSATAHKVAAALSGDYQPGPNALRRQMADECKEIGGDIGAAIAQEWFNL